MLAAAGSDQSEATPVVEYKRDELMTLSVGAVYENGVLRLDRPVNLADKTRVHVTIESEPPARTALGQRLREIRSEIVASGVPALGWDEIEDEVAARRGGWRESR